MQTFLICGTVLGIGLAVALAMNAGAAEAAKGPRIVHNVFFALNDKSPEAKAKLIAACQKFLTKHPGTVFFAAGGLAEELNRPVNDRDFDVALHIVFEDQKAHDAYQDHARHVQFIDENKANWKKVRVFDSAVE